MLLSDVSVRSYRLSEHIYRGDFVSNQDDNMSRKDALRQTVQEQNLDDKASLPRTPHQMISDVGNECNIIHVSFITLTTSEVRFNFNDVKHVKNVIKR